MYYLWKKGMFSGKRVLAKSHSLFTAFKKLHKYFKSVPNLAYEFYLWQGRWKVIPHRIMQVPGTKTLWILASSSRVLGEEW